DAPCTRAACPRGVALPRCIPTLIHPNTMCGIIGYIGKSQAVPILLDGLRRLEYRGYDSAGVAIFDGGKIEIRKRIGRIANLAELIKESPPTGTSGISHTRWATHGGVSDENAH